MDLNMEKDNKIIMIIKEEVMDPIKINKDKDNLLILWLNNKEI